MEISSFDPARINRPSPGKAGHAGSAPAISSSTVSETVASQSMEVADDDDTDTFLYGQNGKPAPAAKEKPQPTGSAGRFASVHEENAFVRDATPEQLAEVWAPENVESILRSRAMREENEESNRQIIENMKRQNPEFVANSYKGQASDIVGRIEENLKSVNLLQKRLAAPENQNSAAQESIGMFLARYLGGIKDMTEGLQSIVSISGTLVKQQDDGTYVLSNFSLSYDGVPFLENRE